MTFFDPTKTNIPFIQYRKILISISVVLIAASIALLATKGLNFGVDFTGGLVLQVEFEKPVTLNGVLDTLKSAEGVVLMDDPQNTVYPTPLECADRDEVFVGRVRLDPTVPSGINMWVVADNIRKGAATNAVQIAERIIAKAQAR